MIAGGRRGRTGAVSECVVTPWTRRGGRSSVGEMGPSNVIVVGAGPTGLLTGQFPRLYEALRPGRFVLISDEGVPKDWADRVESVRAARPGLPATLVRPDGYIAWAGDIKGAGHALARWCGPAASAP